MDTKCARFYTMVGPQPSGQEVIENLEQYVIEGIRKFNEKWSGGPKRVIFLRDGEELLDCYAVAIPFPNVVMPLRVQASATHSFKCLAFKKSHVFVEPYRW